MSISVGGYAQPYPHHAGPLAHDFYQTQYAAAAAVHQGVRFPDSHHPHPEAATGHYLPPGAGWILAGSGSYPQDHPGVTMTAEEAAAAAAAGYATHPGIHNVDPPNTEYTYAHIYDPYNPQTRIRCVKRRVSANKKERRRTESINSAFAQLRGCIPNVPSDTKLSKIKTLRLATSYISYLMEVLAKEETDLNETGFKADISRKQNKDKKKEDSVAGSDGAGSDTGSSCSDDRKTKGRTGWPQHVWASELKQ